MMTWDDVLAPIKNSDNYKKLWETVEEEYDQYLCFPPKDEIFRALEITPFSEVKVVIIGQDPYHNDDQANGLSFSVRENVKTPPSLKNIFTELKSDLGISRDKNDLEDWAKQGVLLLNASLTVRAHTPNSHKNVGWDYVTNFIIKEIADRKDNVVFVLWGAFAQKKAEFINSTSHYIIRSAHPSPFSVYRGFYGSQPFSKINTFLKEHQLKEIVW